MGRQSYENGIKGEEMAVEYLVGQGYYIKERNFHSRQGEIDIIAEIKNFVVFVEVKNYSYRSYGSPVGAVGKSKKQSIIHAAQTYLFQNQIKDKYFRFDVLTIYTKRDGSRIIEHYKDAFYVS